MTIFLFAPWELQIHRMLTKLHAGYTMCEISGNFFERFTSLSEIAFLSHSIHRSLSFSPLLSTHRFLLNAFNLLVMYRKTIWKPQILVYFPADIFFAFLSSSFSGCQLVLLFIATSFCVRLHPSRRDTWESCDDLWRPDYRLLQ